MVHQDHSGHMTWAILGWWVDMALNKDAHVNQDCPGSRLRYIPIGVPIHGEVSQSFVIQVYSLSDIPTVFHVYIYSFPMIRHWFKISCNNKSVKLYMCWVIACFNHVPTCTLCTRAAVLLRYTTLSGSWGTMVLKRPSLNVVGPTTPTLPNLAVERWTWKSSKVPRRQSRKRSPSKQVRFPTRAQKIWNPRRFLQTTYICFYIIVFIVPMGDVGSGLCVRFNSCFLKCQAKPQMNQGLILKALQTKFEFYIHHWWLAVKVCPL